MTGRPPKPGVTHGDALMYWRGCRCVLCKAAVAAYQRSGKKSIRAQQKTSATVASGSIGTAHLRDWR